MRATEFITELFQSGKKWKWEFKGSEEAFASFEVGGIEYLWYARVMNIKNPTAWTVAFRVRDSGDWDETFGITGTGNSAEVMSTVIDITRAFLQTYGDKVLEIRFSSAENSRTSLYAKMVKRLLPTWNMHSKRVAGETDFFLTNPRAYEMIGEEIEMVDEAINMTHLDEPMKKAVEDGIKTAIGNLYDAKGGYPKLEDRFDTGEGTSAFLNQMVAMLFSDFEKWNVVDIVTKSVVAGLTKELGKDVVKKFKFTDTGDNYGQAGISSIDINENLIKGVAKKAIENLVEATLSSYGEGELTGGFWYMINSIRRGEKDYVGAMFERSEKRINLIASTIVHEVVHVLQHKRQKDAKRPRTQYRSYLDKKGGEFINLAVRREKEKKREKEEKQKQAANSSVTSKRSKKPTWTDSDEKRYFNLYYASPQEIASFSNEIAIKIIRDFGIDGARSVEELNNAASVVDAESVIHYVREHLEDRFKAPENKREYAVFKRYVKLTYTALQSWLTKQRERLKD